MWRNSLVPKWASEALFILNDSDLILSCSEPISISADKQPQKQIHLRSNQGNHTWLLPLLRAIGQHFAVCITDKGRDEPGEINTV